MLKSNRMATAVKRSTKKRVNSSQPSYILRQRQLQRIRALLAEQRRQEMMQKQFELFLAAQTQTQTNNNNNNWYFPAEEEKKRQRKTRKLRR